MNDRQLSTSNFEQANVRSVSIVAVRQPNFDLQIRKDSYQIAPPKPGRNRLGNFQVTEAQKKAGIAIARWRIKPPAAA
jgi:hypothetical protein